MPEELTDTELVAAFKGGDPEALGLLMERHKAALYGYLLRLTGRAEAAEDVFQEVFLKLVRNPSAYGEKEKFKAWLFTVARNAAMDQFRRQATRAEVPLEGDGYAPGPADFLASAEPGPEGAFYGKVLGERIAAALAGLSEDQREVFYLRHYSELSFKEIADLLKLPIGTVLARMSRAAAKLREKLQKDMQ
ncbi:MAG: sigma-70 family RNA polymerase sigma factor [Elusimicrobiales bacterium]|nr:sigma-70 family RNA polymerase sigma factor [Elusimicrobiales bacterium]